MTKTEKKNTRIQYATRAMIASLTRYNELNPGECITRPRLFPNVIRRAAQLMDEELDATFDEEALVPPDEQFLYNHMGEIRQKALDQYKKYIIWNPPHHKGIRLGTFQEMQDLPCPKLTKIADGIRKTVDKMAHSIGAQGGTTIGFSMETKQIGSGNGNEKQELANKPAFGEDDK